jgi:hypothetical protein
MAADTVISGVIRGILPYAVIGGVGLLGYTYLRKKGVLADLKSTADNVFRAPQIIVKKIAEIPEKIPLPDNPIIPAPKQTTVLTNNDGFDGYLVEKDKPSILDVGYDGFSDNVDRTIAAAEAAQSGDWVEAGQNIARNVPTIYAAEKIFNRLFGR